MRRIKLVRFKPVISIFLGVGVLRRGVFINLLLLKKSYNMPNIENFKQRSSDCISQKQKMNIPNDKSGHFADVGRFKLPMYQIRCKSCV